jgi:predicted DNA-binding ribbon-helix-helix protein
MSTLVSRNITLRGRRTSVRLEPPMWDAFEEIAQREGMTLSALSSLVDTERRESSLTAAIRLFILAYFRAAATEDGHKAKGYGTRDSLHYRPRRGRPRGSRNGANGAASGRSKASGKAAKPPSGPSELQRQQ